MPYGYLEGEARESEKARVAAEYARIDAEITKCRYCKAAKTRARHRLEDVIKSGGDVELYERLAEKAACSAHTSRRRLVYVTSPLSETYWAS